MDEQTTPSKEYAPRPAWQVWGARIALVLLIIGILGYYRFIAYPT